MGLLALPLRFMTRQSRWFARGVGVIAAAGVFGFLSRHETIQAPGMPEPYTVGFIDPYWTGAAAYLLAAWVVRRVLGILLRGAGSHIQRVSSGEWFRR